MLLNIFRKLQFVPQILTLLNHLIPEKVSQLHDVVYVVTVLYVVWLVYHPDIVENVVLSCHELE